MAPTSTRTKKDDTVEIEFEDGVMFEREGFDRRNIRYELADPMNISLDDLFIEHEQKEFVDPRTLDIPFGPTGFGETAGSGVETVRIEGDRFRTYRYATGFEYNAEEGVTDLDAQQEAITETFAFLADANFLKGMDDQRNGTEIKQGVFDWLKSNIPAERTLDCENYDGDSGDEADYTETPESIIKYEAYEKISGDLLTRQDPNWDMMIGRQPALARMNKPTKTNTGRQTYRELVNAGNAKGGISDDMLLPDEMKLDVVPEDYAPDEQPPTVDLTTELDRNELILIPDMDIAAREWFRLAEMDAPNEFGPMEMRQGRRAVDYAWRYTHKFDPFGHYPDAKDAIRLTNIDAIFD